MSDQEKHRQPRTPVRALGDNPFADMDTLEWLGVESPPAPETPAPEPKLTISPENDITLALDLPDDEAERALQEWLRDEKPPETPPTDATLAPDAQARLLTRLLAEQNPSDDSST